MVAKTLWLMSMRAETILPENFFALAGQGGMTEVSMIVLNIFLMVTSENGSSDIKLNR